MNTVVVDVREPQEYATGHVEGAINIPPDKLMAGARELDHLAKDTPLILYCVSGSRSNVSIRILQSLGFTNLTNGINKDQTQKLLTNAK
jgi:phage shock protein E